jgi:hypothetical protein
MRRHVRLLNVLGTTLPFSWWGKQNIGTLMEITLIGTLMESTLTYADGMLMSFLNFPEAVASIQETALPD